ncbi:protein kinase 4 isoform X2 [Drosophila willistoni]|nr:protein kinase 4 isoform X2 [Drosophila willistoni]XP_046867118.1 protein kinase 4 isoform X2 [Drosophila willistoni]
MGRKKRKPEQDQEQQYKQHKGNNQGRQHSKMFYNSNSRRSWSNDPNYLPSITNMTTTNNYENKSHATSATTTTTTGNAIATTSYDNMQRRNSNNQNNNKRYPQKYNLGCNNGNGNLAGAGAGGAATAADIMTTNGTNGAYKNPSSRKSRYNKRQQQQDQQQKRSADTKSTSQPASWLKTNFGHHFVTSSSVTSSSCIEEKFLVTHNPGHRNSTSSEVTTSSEDLDSSREHLNRSKADGGTANHSTNNNANNNKKSRAKRQSKPPAKPGKNPQQQQQQTQQVNKSKATGATGAGSGNGNGNKWRQVNNQQQPQQQQPQQQQHKQRSHQQKKKNGNNLANKSLHQMNSSSSSGNSSCSSSALSSPTNSPGKPGKQQQLQHLHHHHQMQLHQHQQQQQQSLLDWPEFAASNLNFHVPPLQQFEQMEMEMNDAHALVMQQLRRHIIGHHLLRVYGFPVESVVHEGAIEIFKCLPPHVGMNHHVELAATKQLPVTVINCHDGLTTTTTTTAAATGPGMMSMDNGASSSSFSTSLSSDSGNSSPRNLDSENSSAGEWSGSECTGDLELDFCTSDVTSSSSSSFSGGEEVEEEDVSEEDQQQAGTTSLAKQCTRCAHHFLVDEQTGEYITQEECCYHEGKYQHYAGRWSCCQMATELAMGCCQNDYHVWAGSVVGVNGPYHDFVRTTHRSHHGSAMSDSLDNPSVYALDCEMSYTARGLDVTKVSLVALNGQLIYEQFVQPDCPIVDFNTRYSGITEQDLLEAKSLAQVQRDLLEIISADTILIGHGLDNDLRALRIVHNTLIDTSITFPHASGFPYRRALRHLTKMHLKREIQCGDGTTGHSSFEDSRACMELMLWRVRRELLDPNWSWED